MPEFAVPCFEVWPCALAASCPQRFGETAPVTFPSWARVWTADVSLGASPCLVEVYCKCPLGHAVNKPHVSGQPVQLFNCNTRRTMHDPAWCSLHFCHRRGSVVLSELACGVWRMKLVSGSMLVFAAGDLPHSASASMPPALLV